MNSQHFGGYLPSSSSTHHRQHRRAGWLPGRRRLLPGGVPGELKGRGNLSFFKNKLKHKHYDIYIINPARNLHLLYSFTEFQWLC